MKPISSSALFFAQLFSTLAVRFGPAADDGRGPEGQNSPATENKMPGMNGTRLSGGAVAITVWDFAELVAR